jgi:hypothetical protein
MLDNYPPMAYVLVMVIIETPIFTDQIQAVTEDDDYAAFC